MCCIGQRRSGTALQLLDELVDGLRVWDHATLVDGDRVLINDFDAGGASDFADHAGQVECLVHAQIVVIVFNICGGFAPVVDTGGCFLQSPQHQVLSLQASEIQVTQPIQHLRPHRVDAVAFGGAIHLGIQGDGDAAQLVHEKDEAVFLNGEVVVRDELEVVHDGLRQSAPPNSKASRQIMTRVRARFIFRLLSF